MATRIRGFDWSATSLGPITDWPLSLKTVVDLMLASVQPVFIAWGPELIVLYNDSCASILADKHPETLGLPCSLIWSEVWADMQPEADAVMTGQPRQFTNHQLSLAGRSSPPPVRFNSFWTPIYDERGSVGGIYCVAIPLDEVGGGKSASLFADVTAPSNAEVARRSVEERLLAESEKARAQITATLESIGDAFYAVDADFRLTYVNTRAESLWGRSRETLIGKNLWEEFSLAVGGEPHARHIAAMRNRQPVHFEGRSPVLDRWMEASLYPDPASGGLACFFRDITDRRRAEAALRESEARYRNLFETMRQGYVENEMIRDPDGRAFDYRTLAVNPQFERLTGISAGEAVGRTARELVGELDPLWIETYDRVVRTGQPDRFEREEPAFGRWFEVQAYPLTGDRFAILYDDITERRQTEAALRESEERQAFLLSFSDALRPIRDPMEIQRTATRLLGEYLKASRVFYVVIEADGDTAEVLSDYTDGVSSRVGRYSLSAFSTSAVSEWRAGRVARTGDVDTDPRYSEAERAAYASVSTRAGIGIPLVKEGQLVAILGVNQATPRQWSDFDIDLSSDVAERTWAALERARAEAALRESEELQRLTIELVPALLWSASPDGEEVSLNEGWLTYTGQSEAETQHFGWLNAIHPDDLPAVRASFQHAFATGEPLERQHRIKKANDGWRWHLVRHVPVRDDGDNITGWFGAAVDIHEGNFAEQALRDSEERFRQFSEASSDVLWIVDASSRRLEFLSAAFDRVWGVPRATVMNDQAIWATMLHPDDREQALTAMPRALAGEQVIQEYRIIRGDGAIRYITDVGFPIFGVDGSVVRVGGIAQDLTERRQAEAAVRASERRQRALIDGLPQLVWRAFDGGHWTWASPQWTEFTGQAEADSHGWGWLDLVHPDDRDQVKNIWGGAIERGEFHADYRVFHGSEGRYRWFQTRATPVRDDQGVIVEWLGTSTDVDDLRQMQERQQALVAELQHRTRNLMGVVRSMANRTGETSTGYEDFRERFRDRLEALARVQGLLSRLNETDRISFDELVGTEIKAMSHASERVALDGPSGIRLRSSTVQTLAMALHELATNAVKYGALGQSNGHLAISWRMVEPDRRGRPRLRIEWRETCVKMPPLGAAPQGGGQGRELIEKALPYQLSAETSFELGPDGVHCTITIPVSDTTVVEDANV